MRFTGHRFASVIVVTVFLAVACSSEGKNLPAQQLENPAPPIERQPPQPVSLLYSDDSSDELEHSILVDETPSFRRPVPPQKTETAARQVHTPDTDSPVPQDLTAAPQSPSRPPISTNALRGSTTQSQSDGNHAVVSSPPSTDMAFDEQPQPPRSMTQSSDEQSSSRSLAPNIPDQLIPQANMNSPVKSSSGQQPIQDSNVVPAQYEVPASQARNQTAQTDSRSAPPKQKVNLSLTRQIMKRYETDSVSDPLPGRPVKILEMLTTTPQSLHKQMINQYWVTYFDWTAVLNSTQHLDWLNQLPRPHNPADDVLLGAAKSAIKNQVLADEIQLGKSQSKLQQFMVGRKDNQLPLPSDKPLMRTYDSHYDWYESRNRLPANLRGINTMLPKSIRLIADRANTVGTTRVALSQVRAAYVANPRELGSILEAARLWNRAEQNLVASIVNYNQAITDYALSLTPGYKPPHEIVAMLITEPKRVARQQTPQRDTAQRQRPTNGQNSGQPNSRFQNASQSSILSRPDGTGSGSVVPYRNDPISRTMNLNPQGFSQRVPQQPTGHQPASQAPSTWPMQNQPVNPPVQKAPVQPPPVDRNAFRGNDFGGQPASTPRMSQSAREFNSFGR